MNINELHKLTGDLIALGDGETLVVVDTLTVFEGENGENLALIESGKLETARLVGLMDEEEKEVTEDFFVLRGS